MNNRSIQQSVARDRKTARRFSKVSDCMKSDGIPKFAAPEP